MMENAEGTEFSLPLFLLDEGLQEREMAAPDMVLNMCLDQDLLDHLCQNPAPDESVALTLNDYRLSNITDAFKEVEANSHQVQLTLMHGPSLAAVLLLEDGRSFVSPQMEMMPTFDLGDE